MRAVIQCGGDADTTGAIVGGIVGASVGREGIPEEWLDRLIEGARPTSGMGSEDAGEGKRVDFGGRPII